MRPWTKLHNMRFFPRFPFKNPFVHSSKHHRFSVCQCLLHCYMCSQIFLPHTMFCFGGPLLPQWVGIKVTQAQS